MTAARTGRTLPARAPVPHVLATCFCLGLVASLAVRAPVGALLLATLGALSSLALGPRRAAALALALAAAGWWWGSLRLEALDRSILTAEIGRAAEVRVEVTGPGRRSALAVRVPVRVVRFGGLALDERAQLVLPPERAPPQGAVLELVATVAEPRAPDGEGSFDEAGYLRRQGVHVLLRADSYRIVGRRGGLGSVADGLRALVARSMAPGLEGERRAVVAGVVLGEDEGLDQELRDRFRASGLYHLLAVSGQNVAYVVFGTLLAAWAVGLPRWLGQTATLASVGAYVLAVGWQPSVVRAGVAGALASLAWLASRPRDRWYFLLVGAAVLLAWNPYGVLEPGFQLSFSAVAAIFVLVPRIERRLEGYPLPRGLTDAIAVSAACGAVTAPVLWLHFGAIPVYSILANALAAPVVAPLLGLALAATAVTPVLPEAAFALAWINGWLASYLAWCARAVGGLPFAQATSATALAGLLGLVCLLLVLTRLRPPRGRRALAVLALAATLVVAWRGSPEQPPPPPSGFRLTLLDVGQGDAILLQVPEGAVLVDGGPPEAHVADQLRTLGVKRLAAIVVTHPHRDHVGGAAEVLDELPVGFVLDPLQPSDSPEQRSALAEARREGVSLVPARVGRSFRLGRLRLRVLWPDDGGIPGEDAHRHGVVLLASYGAVDALLTGDSEGDVTVPLRPPPVEILKVAHHGSEDARLAELLELTAPEVALVSVAAGNEYGLPAPATLAALRGMSGLAVYRTDEDGRVTLDSDGREFTVRGEG